MIDLNELKQVELDDLLESLGGMTNFNRVNEFHDAFGHPVLSTPAVPDIARIKLRINLILEEAAELIEACTSMALSNNLRHAAVDVRNAMNHVRNAKESDFETDIVEVADALTDILYVAYGAGLEFGVDLDATFREVHRSNMTKLGEDGKPIYNPDTGKVVKGPNYQEPDLASVLNSQNKP